MGPFFFEKQSLCRRAETLRDKYKSAEPFPHALIDEFLPEPVVNQIVEEFPTPEAIPWKQADRYVETKLSSEDEEVFPPFTRQVLQSFNSSVFVTFLEELTGIRGLIPDPHFRGGGLHQIGRSGRLGIHADFNYYERLKLCRRINVLLYLNRGWDSQWGGQLELWDRGMQHCVRRIDPVLNRCVIFNTTDDAYHGHPDPLDCPADTTRKSLALYYYTADATTDDEATKAHPTIFRKRPGEEAPSRDFVRQWLLTLARKTLPKRVLAAARRARGINH